MIAIAIDQYERIKTETRPSPRGRDPERLAAVHDGAYRQLALAMLMQAIRDAAGIGAPNGASAYHLQALRTEAREWLMWDGAHYAELVGMDPDKVRIWVNEGCKYDRYEIQKLRRKEKRQAA